ncbi:MAG: STAS/SEC14 domain-containing protein [Proteobacteria bacterium]|nr:STAS/SEC14 domain-containing protein [Pseudomonadota bacterium]
MLTHQLDTTSGILSVEPKEPLTEQDFLDVAKEVDAYLANHDNLTGIIISAAHFPGWENFSGLVEHLRFVRKHQEHINRIAVLTDNPFLQFPPLFVAYFVHPVIKVFPLKDWGAATLWLRETAKV